MNSLTALDHVIAWGPPIIYYAFFWMVDTRVDRLARDVHQLAEIMEDENGQ